MNSYSVIRVPMFKVKVAPREVSLSGFFELP